MKSGVLEVFDSAIFQIIFCSFFFLLNQKERTPKAFEARQSASWLTSLHANSGLSAQAGSPSCLRRLVFPPSRLMEQTIFG